MRNAARPLFALAPAFAIGKPPGSPSWHRRQRAHRAKLRRRIRHRRAAGLTLRHCDVSLLESHHSRPTYRRGMGGKNNSDPQSWKDTRGDPYWRGAWASTLRSQYNQQYNQQPRYDPVQVGGKGLRGNTEDFHPWNAGLEADARAPTITQAELTAARKADVRIRRLTAEKELRQKQWEKFVQDQRRNLLETKASIQRGRGQVEGRTSASGGSGQGRRRAHEDDSSSGGGITQALGVSSGPGRSGMRTYDDIRRNGHRTCRLPPRSLQSGAEYGTSSTWRTCPGFSWRSSQGPPGVVLPKVDMRCRSESGGLRHEKATCIVHGNTVSLQVYGCTEGVACWSVACWSCDAFKGQNMKIAVRKATEQRSIAWRALKSVCSAWNRLLFWGASSLARKRWASGR